MRLSLVQQSADAAYHLESDAETAITRRAGNTAPRRTHRLLLNFTTRSARAPHYLDIDPMTDTDGETAGRESAASRP